MSRPTHGLRDWLLQRISAVYLAGFLVFFILRIAIRPAQDFQAWHDWIAHPAMTVAGTAFVLAVLLHAWFGIRDIVLDYVHTLWLRLLLLSVVGPLLGGCGLWTLHILLPVAR
ncbi:MAG TPA: succinate dehydrogenase, hydrophobic membrane anchor protein [Gammaproteobacteria bacterium]|nr:succinate dehydrogenase, hydrophobic membrane anchor protein [Gammaproteobacteria bacterium]